MSKIMVEYDTVKKEAYATIDGKAVTNLANIYCGHSYNDDDGNPKFSFEISTVEVDQDNKMMKMQRVMASLKKPDAKQVLHQAIANRVFPSA